MEQTRKDKSSGAVEGPDVHRLSWGWLLVGLMLLGLALWLAFAKSKAEFLRAAPGINGVEMKLNNE